MRVLFLMLLLFLSGCTGLPRGVSPVEEFDLNRYLGKWYEIARLDHRFERGLSNVTAEYSLLSPGRVQVKNRGFGDRRQAWKEAIGKAKFKSDERAGHLLVSFFGPLYGSYIVFNLNSYESAYVAGHNRNYLWYLSRTPTVTQAAKDHFIAQASALGFDTDKLIWVNHTDPGVQSD